MLVVGPAGTGKTTALAPAVAQLRADGRAVFGVAPSATAAEVLSDETGLVADTLDKLLIEHRLNRPPDHRYDLPVGATVIVDEAGMLPTAKLAELADLADLKGWRIALVGDPLQFSAVGRGGMFGLLVDTFGAIELDRVHRFDNDWEREASLRLRRGDVTVAEVYEAHGRLHGGTLNQMERASVAAWWERRQAGNKGLLMSPTNEATERLNQRCQQTRIKAGEIDPNGRHLTVGVYEVHVGDEIATRQNERRLITDRGEMVRNRAIWTVDHIHPDGSLTATGKNGTVRLPADYVAEHVELAYARTVMGAQGRNVQGGQLLREAHRRPQPLRRHDPRHRHERSVHGHQRRTDRRRHLRPIHRHRLDRPPRPRPTSRTPRRETPPPRPARRPWLGRARSGASTRERRSVEREKAEAERTIAEADAALDKAQALLDRYDRPLHRRKHEAEITNAKRDLARLPRTIDEARSQIDQARETFNRIDQRLAGAAALLCRRPELEAKVSEIDDRVGADHRVRTRIARLERSEAIVATIGERPAPGPAAAWDLAAAHIDQHQAAFGGTGLGPRPLLRRRRRHTDSRAKAQRLISPLYRPHVGQRKPGKRHRALKPPTAPKKTVGQPTRWNFGPTAGTATPPPGVLTART